MIPHRFHFCCGPLLSALTIVLLVSGTMHGQSAVGRKQQRAHSAPPAINVWYGHQQSFGQIGDPVPAINILGNVFDADGLAWLGYSLNGGDTVRLSIGPDGRRLAARGDFNIDIPYPTLLTGLNGVVIMARDSAGETSRDSVVVNYSRGNTWPTNYGITWNTAANIQDVAQVVDGLWSITGDGLRPLATGYDRFVAVGEGTWDDYEVTVPVTIHRFDSAGYAPPSNGGGVGFALRWPGHSDSPAPLAGRQPKTGYLPLGALGWYTYSTGREGLVIVGNNAAVVAQDTTGRVLQMGVQYIFKMRIQTNAGVGGLYRLKVWRSGLPEPPAWDLTAQQTLADPQSGCLLLAAHNVDATFGDVRIVSLADTTGPPSTIKSDDFHTGVLDTTIWKFINPLGDGALGFTGVGTRDAWVRLTAPGTVPHQPWTDGNRAPRIMQPANNTNFEIESRFESPLTERYQIQGMLVQQDSSNVLRFDFNSDGGTTRLFCAGLHNGVATIRANIAVAPNGSTPLLMRVKRRADQWTFSYSLNEKTWVNAATFVDHMVVSSVGLFGGNTGSPVPAHVASADYFFNTASPIFPEDPTAIGPSITQQPVSRTVAVGQTATFTVVAAGTAPLSYQWQKNAADIGGATSASYTTPPAALADNGAAFRCIVSNAAGSVTSAEAILTIAGAPVITQQPVNDTVRVGERATFTVAATGTAPLSYRWQKNGVNISGAASASYMTPPATAGDSGAAFRCRVSNAAGSATSAPAILLVIVPPAITQQPVDANVHVGQTATFTVAASGTPPLAYQWQRNGATISGATSAMYTIPPAVLSDDGTHFRCRVSNSAGSATSSDATLHVSDAGTRVIAGLLALYTFHEGSGDEVRDGSGVLPLLDLEIAHPSRVSWHPGYLAIERNTVVRSDGPATKVIAASMQTNELSIEAWIRPEAGDGHDDSPRADLLGAHDGDDDDDEDNGPAVIVSNAQKQTVKLRNFSLESFNDRYIGRLRTTETDNQIRPNAASPDHVVEDELTHLLYTRSEGGVAKLYVNGEVVKTATVGGNLSNWNTTYPLSIANEVSLNRPWYGDIHLVALYRRSLSASEVQQNYSAGPDPELVGEAITAGQSAIGGETGIPGEFMVRQNFPNPFNPQTDIGVEIAEFARGGSASGGGSVKLAVYDLLGREVAVLLDGPLEPGRYSVRFDGSNLSSGTYLYRLTAGDVVQVRKMILMK
jgi:hypothetical protein